MMRNPVPSSSDLVPPTWTVSDDQRALVTACQRFAQDQLEPLLAAPPSQADWRDIVTHASSLDLGTMILPTSLGGMAIGQHDLCGIVSTLACGPIERAVQLTHSIPALMTLRAFHALDALAPHPIGDYFNGTRVIALTVPDFHTGTLWHLHDQDCTPVAPLMIAPHARGLGLIDSIQASADARRRCLVVLGTLHLSNGVAANAAGRRTCFDRSVRCAKRFSRADMAHQHRPVLVGLAQRCHAARRCICTALRSRATRISQTDHAASARGHAAGRHAHSNARHTSLLARAHACRAEHINHARAPAGPSYCSRIRGAHPRACSILRRTRLCLRVAARCAPDDMSLVRDVAHACRYGARSAHGSTYVRLHHGRIEMNAHQCSHHRRLCEPHSVRRTTSPYECWLREANRDDMRDIADWLARAVIAQWFDFGLGRQSLTLLAVQAMTQSDRHRLRVFGVHGTNRPSGLVAISDVTHRLVSAPSGCCATRLAPLART